MFRMSQTTAHYDPMFEAIQFGPRSQKLPPMKKMVQDEWELAPGDIEVVEQLGEGAFGEVHKGYLKGPLMCSKVKPCFRNAVFLPIAIKLLKDEAKGSERRDFLSEIDMMKKVSELHSPHVVGMLGAVTLQEPVCLITEFVVYGDLLSYLRTNRKMYITHSTTHDDPYAKLGKFTPLDLTSFSYQIAAGMADLSKIGIVHRDLACRNILVDEEKVLKITDFGLSRETEEVYIQQSKGRVPFKWMAIESIIAREFTTASDVWSYGVVLWEIRTIGGIPYPGIANEQLLPRLKGGYRMEKPDNCSSEMYNIMLSCWNEDVNKRPTFEDLKASVGRLLEAESQTPYIDFSINPDSLCYHVADEIISPNKPLHKPLHDNKRRSSDGVTFHSQSFPNKICMPSWTSENCIPEMMASRSNTPSTSTKNSSDSSKRPLSLTQFKKNDDADRYVVNPGQMTDDLLSPLIPDKRISPFAIAEDNGDGIVDNRDKSEDPKK